MSRVANEGVVAIDTVGGENNGNIDAMRRARCRSNTSMAGDISEKRT